MRITGNIGAETGEYVGKAQVIHQAEIKRIADYIKDLEEGLYEWDYRAITAQGQLTELYRIIKRLTNTTFEADHEFKPLLVSLEYKARKCKQCIKARTAVRN